MKNLLIPILLVLALLQSCAPANNNLVPDETAKKIFTPTELTGIAEMIKLVDSKVAANENVTDINQAYHAYFDKLNVLAADGKMPPALFSDSVKFSLPETLGNEAFSAVWKISNSAKIDSASTDLHGFKTLVLNPEGKYPGYLKATGKSDSLYRSIAGGIENAGDISPSVTGWFLAQHKAFDFTLFKNRLWATVFILRMSEPAEERTENNPK